LDVPIAANDVLEELAALNGKDAFFDCVGFALCICLANKCYFFGLCVDKLKHF
jgi:hypothetical protein